MTDQHFFLKSSKEADKIQGIVENFKKCKSLRDIMYCYFKIRTQ